MWQKNAKCLMFVRRLAGALCATYGFDPELHRYVPCEPDEVSVADYWISPHAIGLNVGMVNDGRCWSKIFD